MSCVGCPDCNHCPNCCVRSSCGAQGDQVLLGALRLIGAPAPGVNNLNNLRMWRLHECGGPTSTGAGFNPLNTTVNYGFNGARVTYSWWNCEPWYVKCYANLNDGISALAATWKNSGYYPAILNALLHDWTLAQWACDSALRAELKTWGTGDGWLPSCTGHDPCMFVTCPTCQHCVTVNGVATCTPVLCPAGEVCSNGICVATGKPPSPPPPSTDPVPLVLIGAGLALIGVYAYRDPQWRSRIFPHAGRRDVQSRASFRRGRSPS